MAGQYRPIQTVKSPQINTSSSRGSADSCYQSQSISTSLPRRGMSSTSSAMKMMFFGWIMELLSWVLSVLCFGAIAVLLWIYNQKPVPQFRLGLTLNALIALFATLSKVALMSLVAECISQLKWAWFAGRDQSLFDFELFDQASRGEKGSLKLLFKMKKAFFPYSAAIITISAIAASTLTQQTVTQQVRMVPSSTAKIPRTFVFKKVESPGSSTGFSVVAESGVNIKNAAYIGLWTNFTKTIQPFEPICSTGNCTWPTYQSLGVCARMSDVSNLIAKDEAIYNDLVRRLPNGAFLNISATGVNAINVTNANDGGFLKETPGKLSSLEFQDLPEETWIADLFVIIDYSEGEGTNTSAVELALNFCTREYNTVVTNGQASTKETIVATEYNLTTSAPLDINAIFTGSTSDGMPTTDVAELFAQAVYAPPANPANLLAIMKNIATSLTNTIRAESGDGSTSTGTEYSSEIYIRVRWLWLIFLGVLVCASGVLLIGTIIQTQRTGTAIWKSSSLATLHALDGNSRKMNVLETEKSMEARSKQVSARLIREEDGHRWRLTYGDDSEMECFGKSVP